VTSVAVVVLLVIAGLTAVISVTGVALMPGTYNRLHYLAPVSVVGSAAVAVAVILREELNTRGIKVLIVFAVLAALNPLIIHATARAGRVRQHGDWRQPEVKKGGR
jgi:monovalent cation/proton antiporter MnhG/PhaG subunit